MKPGAKPMAKPAWGPGSFRTDYGIRVSCRSDVPKENVDGKGSDYVRRGMEMFDSGVSDLSDFNKQTRKPRKGVTRVTRPNIPRRVFPYIEKLFAEGKVKPLKSLWTTQESREERDGYILCARARRTEAVVSMANGKDE